MRVIQITTENIPEVIQKCMTSVKLFYPNVEIYSISNTGSIRDIYTESERLRFKICAESEEPVLYLDWDTLLFDKLILPDSAAFGRWRGYYVDYHRIWTNGDKSLFQKIYTDLSAVDFDRRKTHLYMQKYRKYPQLIGGEHLNYNRTRRQYGN